MARRAIAIGGVGLIGVALLLFAAPRATPRPSSYREAVAAVLERRGTLYQAVVVIEPCDRDSDSCQQQWSRWSFSTIDVHITTQRQQPVKGRIDCHYYRADCYLTIPPLGLINVPLRDLAGLRSRPGGFERIVEYMRRWLFPSRLLVKRHYLPGFGITWASA